MVIFIRDRECLAFGHIYPGISRQRGFPALNASLVVVWLAQQLLQCLVATQPDKLLNSRSRERTYGLSYAKFQNYLVRA